MKSRPLAGLQAFLLLLLIGPTFGSGQFFEFLDVPATIHPYADFTDTSYSGTVTLSVLKLDSPAVVAVSEDFATVPGAPRWSLQNGSAAAEAGRGLLGGSCLNLSAAVSEAAVLPSAGDPAPTGLAWTAPAVGNGYGEPYAAFSTWVWLGRGSAALNLRLDEYYCGQYTTGFTCRWDYALALRFAAAPGRYRLQVLDPGALTWTVAAESLPYESWLKLDVAFTYGTRGAAGGSNATAAIALNDAPVYLAPMFYPDVGTLGRVSLYWTDSAGLGLLAALRLTETLAVESSAGLADSSAVLAGGAGTAALNLAGTGGPWRLAAAAGQHSGRSGAFTAESCAPGSWADPGTGPCETCDAGYACAFNTPPAACGSGFFALAGASECTTCRAAATEAERAQCPSTSAAAWAVPVALLLVAGLVLIVVLLVRRRRAPSAEALVEAPPPSAIYQPPPTALTGAGPAPAPGAEHTVLPADFGRSKFSIRYEDIAISGQLGAGAYGVVFRGEWRGAAVAVKVLRKMDLSAAELAALRAEAQLMKDMTPHRNVVLFYGVCNDPFAIVTEFLARGSLYDALQSGTAFAFELQLRIMQDIAAGMLHLSLEGIIHRDLAARNILLGESYEAKVADFGLSAVVDKGPNEENKAVYDSTEIGPLKWMAPEAIKKKKFSTKSDVWSFGVTCWEILTREKTPYATLDAVQAAAAVCHEGLYPTFPEDINPTLVQILHTCFNFEPHDRPDFSLLLQHLQAVPS